MNTKFNGDLREYVALSESRRNGDSTRVIHRTATCCSVGCVAQCSARPDIVRAVPAVPF